MKKILTALSLMFVLINTAQANMHSKEKSKPTLNIVFAGSPTGSVNKFNEDLVKDLSKWYSIKEIPGVSSTKGIGVYNSTKGPTLLYTRGAQHNANAMIKKQKDALDINKKNILISFEAYDMVCVKKGNGSASDLIASKNAKMKLSVSDSLDFMNMFNDKLNSVTGSNNIMIPFKASGQVVAGLQSGELDVGTINPITAFKAIKSGTIECDTSTNPIATKNTKALKDVLNNNWSGFSYSKHYMIIVKDADDKFIQLLKDRVETLVKDNKSAVGKRLSESFVSVNFNSPSDLYEIYNTAKNNRASYSK